MSVLVIMFIFGNLKGLSDENTAALTTSDYKLSPELSYFGTKTEIEFNGSCLRQDKIAYGQGKIEWSW